MHRSIYSQMTFPCDICWYCLNVGCQMLSSKMAKCTQRLHEILEGTAWLWLGSDCGQSQNLFLEHWTPWTLQYWSYYMDIVWTARIPWAQGHSCQIVARTGNNHSLKFQIQLEPVVLSTIHPHCPACFEKHLELTLELQKTSPEDNRKLMKLLGLAHRCNSPCLRLWSSQT